MSKGRDDNINEFFALMALHNYFLNADFLRDAFLRQLKMSNDQDGLEFVRASVNVTAMSLWYATVYVVIEGWRQTGRHDPALDALLENQLVDQLRVFRNQVFHYQTEYDNPRLLRFRGNDNAVAKAVTDWISEVHVALGAAIERVIEELLDEHEDEDYSDPGPSR